VSDIPIEARADIAEVLRWIEAHPGGRWEDMGDLYDRYRRWQGIIRRQELLDGTGDMHAVPGLSSFGRLFLLSPAPPPVATTTPNAPQGGPTLNLNTLLTAPSHTPSPLSEIYDLVADAVFVACGFRQEMAEFERHRQDFKAAALALANARGRANEALQEHEIWLHAHAREAEQAFRAALEAIEPVNHACSHVLVAYGANASEHLTWDFRPCPEGGSCLTFSGDTRAFFAAMPLVDQRAILSRMRHETKTAAARLVTGYSPESSAPLPAPRPAELSAPRQSLVPAHGARSPDDPPAPGIRDVAAEQLDALRGKIAALERFFYEPGRLAHEPGFERNQSYTGSQELSPSPHNRVAAIHTLIKMCLDVRRALRNAHAGLELPEPPAMPAGLCDFPPNDGRHELAFQGAVERLSEWADSCDRILATRHSAHTQPVNPPPALPVPAADLAKPSSRPFTLAFPPEEIAKMKERARAADERRRELLTQLGTPPSDETGGIPGAMLVVLAREYGWGPDVFAGLTDYQIDLYLQEALRQRASGRPGDAPLSSTPTPAPLDESRGRAAARLVEAVQGLQAVAQDYYSCHQADPPRFPVQEDYDRVCEAHARCVGLAAAAGLPAPPPMDECGLMIYDRVSTAVGSDGKAVGMYQLRVGPNGAAHKDWMARLSQLVAAARAAATPPAAGAPPTPQVREVANPEMSQAAQGALKSPPDAAIKAYRLKWILGVPTQAAISERLSEELGRPVSQGQVSRWLQQAEEFASAGGVLPGLPDVPAKKPMPVDPERLDLGPRQDGRTERQRKRRSDDD
jgi:hypothetical protein